MSRTEQQGSGQELVFRHVSNETEDVIVGLIPEWRAQGIEFRLGEPQATDGYDSDELGRMGLIGVEFLKPEDLDS